jgi:hypothetical protein
MMGGRGGGWFPLSDRVERNVERVATDEAVVSSYESEANSFLQDLLRSYNDRDTDAIHRHLDVLRQAISKDIEGVIDMQFGGSIPKHTYVDGLSDADVLVIVNESSLSNTSPPSVLRYLEECIQARLPNTKVKAGTLAVTITYSNGFQVQLLPALKTATGVRIPSPDASGWSNVVRPQEFARKLTEVNQACGNMVIPAIKLFKGLQERLPKTSQLAGYHIESLAIEAFKDYSGRRTYKDMLQHFIRMTAERVRSPIVDTTGQSLHVDDYLGTVGSTNRIRVAKAFERLTDKFVQADKRTSVDILRDLFSE